MVGNIKVAKETGAKEIRLHGRGGQGAVTAAEMLAVAFVADGKFVAAFPLFGSERRGAPVASFLRVSDWPIRIKTRIYMPDCLIVTDPVLDTLPGIFNGLKPDGILVMNTRQPPKGRLHANLSRIGFVDASGIALKELGVLVPNTCMMGAFAATTGWLSLESILSSLPNYFSGELLKKNLRSAESGFRETKVLTF